MDTATPGSTYETARTVAQWVADGRPATIARMLTGSGLAGRDSAPLAAWIDDGQTIGSPVAAAARGRGFGVTDVSLSDPQAADVGLACGGQARILVQHATDLASAFWEQVAAGAPVGLVDIADGSVSTATFAADDVPAEYTRWFGRGVSQLVDVAPPASTAAQAGVLTIWWPVTALLVVGAGPVAAALTAQAELLGWTTTVTDTRDAALDALQRLGRADAVAVLSHDRAVDGPLLAAAVASSVGYIGAMGSRHTQAARAQWFADNAVPGDLARIHGPAGLDIGGFGPAEIALSIVAEVVANRAGVRERQ